VAHKAKIEQTVFRFGSNAVYPLPGQEEKLQELQHTLAQLFTTGQRLGKPVRVVVVGQTDGRGPEAVNARLGQGRAEQLLALFAAGGLETTRLAAVGVGTKEHLRLEVTEQDRALHRRVSFRVIVGNEQ
jgi:outer membrane protein OmpA-like peptidoglycan-associated protein